MAKLSGFLSAVILLGALAGGCSTHRTTTQEVAYDSRTGEPVTVQRETTTTTDTTQDSGVISGTFNVIGEVIALPFRAVGGLVRAIF